MKGMNWPESEVGPKMAKDQKKDTPLMEEEGAERGFGGYTLAHDQVIVV